jgi:SHS2 domain-containing protein
MPYEELPHTADWSLRIWAADITHLFVESAKGMNALSGIRLADKQRVKCRFSTSAPDTESLLVSYLSELVFFAEKDHLAFDRFELSLDLENNQPCHLSASMHGAPILSMDKSIKAVTYHNLHIQQTARGVEVEIVFDV